MVIAAQTSTDNAIELIRERVQDYIDGVLSGSIIVSRYVYLAVERQVRDEKTGEARGLYFDEPDATFTIQFMETMRHSKGEWAGQQFILSDWEAFCTWCIFGWKHKADNTRRFRTAWIMVARKNGKSTWGAPVGHRLFVGDNEPGAEVYTFATKLKQARIVHEEAKRMVKRSASLRKLVRVLRDNLSIEATDSRYEPLVSDSETLDGLNVSGAIGDEIHAHKNRLLWDVIDTATGARRQPLIFAITTAPSGYNPETIYAELKNYSINVLTDRVEDDSWFAFIAQLDEAQYDPEGNEVSPADDWTDEKNWPKANPNLGVSVKIEDLRRKAKLAHQSPGALNKFLSKHMNRETADVESWLPLGLCDASAGGEWYGPDGIKPEIMERFRGRSCWAGGDLSSVSDLTAVVLAFRNEIDGVDLLPFCWCPRDNAVSRHRDRRVPYMMWAKRGLLSLTESDSVDYDVIRARLRGLRDEWGIDIQEIAMDPHNARYLVTKLEEEDGFNVHEHQQGYVSMNGPIKETDILVCNRKLRHGGHKVLAWCVANAMVPSDTKDNVSSSQFGSNQAFFVSRW